ncbi:MAG: Efflux ABC transporter, permease protein, partial [uncultured Nocardioidaceae bacterium]
DARPARPVSPPRVSLPGDDGPRPGADGGAAPAAQRGAAGPRAGHPPAGAHRRPGGGGPGRAGARSSHRRADSRRPGPGGAVHILHLGCDRDGVRAPVRSAQAPGGVAAHPHRPARGQGGGGPAGADPAAEPAVRRGVRPGLGPLRRPAGTARRRAAGAAGDRGLRCPRPADGGHAARRGNPRRCQPGVPAAGGWRRDPGASRQLSPGGSATAAAAADGSLRRRAAAGVQRCRSRRPTGRRPDGLGVGCRSGDGSYLPVGV